MEALREIEDLVAFEGRGPGTDAERRAADHLKRRLRALGRDTKVEPTRLFPNYALTHAIHAALALAGSLVSLAQPAVGAGLVLLALVAMVGDLTGSFYLVRPLTGSRASQNVLSAEDGGKAGVLILTAHYDAARGGAVFRRKGLERQAALSRRLRIPIGPFQPLVWAILVVLACCAVRLTVTEDVLALDIVQFVATALLIVAIPLLLGIALRPYVPGATDNGSGVATVLRLAERHGERLEHFDLWVLLPGSEEGLWVGMRQFLKAHRHALDRERTIFLNVDMVGNGTVRYVLNEGLLFGYDFHPELVRLCDDIAEEDEENRYGARGIKRRIAGDGHAARLRGYPAISICCLNAMDYSPDYHQPTDTPDRVEPAALESAEAFVSELIERIDDELGPELERLPPPERFEEEEAAA